MTSDDTKVDTSVKVPDDVENWKADNDPPGPGIADATGEIVCGFDDEDFRDYVLHAAQSLPKVTAERDSIRIAATVLQEHAARDNRMIAALYLERDALSARLVETEGKLTRNRERLHASVDREQLAMQQIEALSARVRELETIADDLLSAGDHLNASQVFPELYSRARALIGKEPSK